MAASCQQRNDNTKTTTCGQNVASGGSKAQTWKQQNQQCNEAKCVQNVILRDKRKKRDHGEMEVIERCAIIRIWGVMFN